MDDINWVDLLIVGSVILSMLISVYRGFIKETVSLIAVLLGGWLAFTYNTQAGELFQTVNTPMIRKVIGGSIIFISVLVIAGLINFFVGKTIKYTGLVVADKTFGMAFGVARGSLLIGLAIMLAWPSTLKDESWWKESVLIPKFYVVSEQISKLVPEDLLEKVKEILL
jgi:membrane protein required for colicin V production